MYGPVIGQCGNKEKWSCLRPILHWISALYRLQLFSPVLVCICVHLHLQKNDNQKAILMPTDAKKNGHPLNSLQLDHLGSLIFNFLFVIDAKWWAYLWYFESISKRISFLRKSLKSYLRASGGSCDLHWSIRSWTHCYFLFLLQYMQISQFNWIIRKKSGIAVE